MDHRGHEEEEHELPAELLASHELLQSFNGNRV